MIDPFWNWIAEFVGSVFARFRSDDASENQIAAAGRDIWFSGVLVAGLIVMAVLLIAHWFFWTLW